LNVVFTEFKTGFSTLSPGVDSGFVASNREVRQRSAVEGHISWHTEVEENELGQFLLARGRRNRMWGPFRTVGRLLESREESRRDPYHSFTATLVADSSAGVERF
jgi:hypothetical protein